MTPRRWDDVLADAQAAGYRVAKAVPRGPDHLLLDLVPVDPADEFGTGPLAAQWFADSDRAARVAQATRGPGVRVHGRLVVQPGAADRRLRGLPVLLDSPGARLLAHRPERRAVVRHTEDGRTVFTKVVRPGRADPLAAALDVLGLAGVPVPQVLRVDRERGHVTLSALPGRTLHELIGDPASTPADLHDAGERTGRVLRLLHDVPVAVAAPGSVSEHDGPAEVAVLRRWLGLAESFGTLAPDERRDAELHRVQDELARLPTRGVLLHRDLHDKQVLLAADDDRDDDSEGAVPDAGAGVLDLDLLAVGDPALDLANLLVHLDLRVQQGRCDEQAADAVRTGLLGGYVPDPAVLAAVPVHAAAARLRLLAVYSFRPVAAAERWDRSAQRWPVRPPSADTLAR